MKKNLFLLALLAMLIGFGTSCSDEDDDKKTIEYTVTVASVEYSLFYSGSFFYVPYFVKEKADGEWTSHNSIRGFEHEEGYEYVLKVRREYDKSMEGVMDASLYKYYLVEEISKTRKDSENIEERGLIIIASKGTGDTDLPYYRKFFKSNSQWKKIAPIEGFEFEEGYQYNLEIYAKYNGLNASPKYTYEYISTVDKVKGQSVGLPQ